MATQDCNLGVTLAAWKRVGNGIPGNIECHLALKFVIIENWLPHECGRPTIEAHAENAVEIVSMTVSFAYRAIANFSGAPIIPGKECLSNGARDFL